MRAMVCAAVVFCAWPADAQQSTGGPRPPLLTISAGVLWTAGYNLGDRTATLRGNAIASTPPPFTLFHASSGMGSTAGFQAHVGVRVRSDLSLETGMLYSHPQVATAITADAEGVASISVRERAESVVADFGVAWRPGLERGGRARPFVSGGLGVLRQLHEGRSLLESGVVYYVGAGAQLRLRGATGGRPIGIRGELRSTWRTGGIDFENKVRVYPSLSLSSFIGL